MDMPLVVTEEWLRLF